MVTPSFSSNLEKLLELNPHPVKTAQQRIRELNIFFIPTIIHNKDVKRIKSADLYRHIYMILVMN